MPFMTIRNLPDRVTNWIPVTAQRIFRLAFNEEYTKTKSDAKASRAGWSAIKIAGYAKDPDTGKWRKNMRRRKRKK